MANTVFNGGQVAPGEFGVGALTLVNSTWTNAARYAWELGDGAGSSPGTDWDYLVISNLTLAANPLNPFVIDLGGLSWTNGLPSLTPTGTNSFLIARSLNGGTFSAEAFTTNQWASAVTNYGWWVSAANGDKDLMLNYGWGEFNGYQPPLVVPEPNVLLLWLSSLATLYAARRRLSRSHTNPRR